MDIRPIPAHASRYLESQPQRRSLSDMVFVWLMRSAHPENRVLRALVLPFVIAAIVLAELADVAVIAMQQLAWLQTDGFWLRAYRVFLAFALTLSIAVLALSVVLMAGCGVPSDKPRMDECPHDAEPAGSTAAADLRKPTEPCYVVVFPPTEPTGVNR